jgi:hypothetical protein
LNIKFTFQSYASKTLPIVPDWCNFLQNGHSKSEYSTKLISASGFHNINVPSFTTLSACSKEIDPAVTSAGT